MPIHEKYLNNLIAKDMEFNQIDIEKWSRKEYYLHYINELRCTYSITLNIDITALRTVIKEMDKKYIRHKFI